MEKRVREHGDGWLIPVMRGPNDRPAHNTPHPWKSWSEPISLQRKDGPSIPATYVRFNVDKQPGAFFQQAMETSLRRARARGWRIVDVDTVHQILPDPVPKVTVLRELFS